MSEPNPNTNTNNNQPAPQVQNEPSGGNQQPAFDYEKLASIINGKQTVAEETVLKSYFKEQGLSPEEAKQAITAFKEQKAKNTPDITQLQNEVTSANNAKLQAEINQAATLEAIKQGIDVKTIPYILKLADFNDIAPNGNIDTDKLTEAIKKVIEDVPALKGTVESNTTPGIQRIGGDGGNSNTDATEETLRGIFGIKK